MSDTVTINETLVAITIQDDDSIIVTPLITDTAITVTGGISVGAVDSVNSLTGIVVLSASDVNAVPLTRTLTINSVTYDLSTDRSWTIVSEASPFIADNDTDVPLIARAFSSTQTGNLQEWQISTGAIASRIDHIGNLWPRRIGVGSGALISFDDYFYNAYVDIGDFNVIPDQSGNDVYGSSTFLYAGASNFDALMAIFGGVNSAGALGISNLQAFKFSVDHTANTPLDHEVGAQINVYQDSAAAVARMFGLEVYVSAFSNGGVNLRAGLYVYADDGGGLTTDSYQIYLENAPHAIYTNSGRNRFGDYLDIAEISTPSAPTNTHGRTFMRDVAGKTQYCVLFATGAVQILATEP